MVWNSHAETHVVVAAISDEDHYSNGKWFHSYIDVGSTRASQEILQLHVYRRISDSSRK